MSRPLEEIRADLATCEQLAIVPWPAAARRLLADVPSLLAEVEAAHRFERSVAVERDALLAEVEMCRRIRDEMQDVAGAAVAAKASAYADLASLRGVVQAVEARATGWRRLYDGLDLGANDYGRGVYDCGALILADLAAAADAPQPEQGAQR